MSIPAYAPPSVGSAGLTIASYQSIMSDNIQGFLNIYGQNQFIGYSSAIYQLLAIISLKQADQNLALQLVYNQSSPLTAVGAGLDREVKMNGLARDPFTYSTVALTVTGIAGKVISNGFAQDQNTNLWALPNPTTITGGSITVTATCTTPGNVTAEPGTVTLINTPTNGWAAVTNAVAAVPGLPVEPDSSLRARQAVSVALPALTPIAASIATVLALPGVTRVAPGYPTPGGPGTSIENPTGTTDSWGNPANSVTLVVEGGVTNSVAVAIYAKKTPGCRTNGTTSVVVADPNTGYLNTISFYRPSYTAPFIGVYLHGLAGFTSTALTAVQAALVSYLNSLSIGEAITYSVLYGVVLDTMPSLSQPLFSVKSLTLGLTATGLFTVVPGSSAGTGYVVGDVLTVVQSGASGGTVTVTSVSGGAVTEFAAQATSFGTGYGVASGLATTGGTGSGATVNVTATQPIDSSDLSLLFYQAAQGITAQVVVASI